MVEPLRRACTWNVTDLVVPWRVSWPVAVSVMVVPSAGMDPSRMGVDNTTDRPAGAYPPGGPPRARTARRNDPYFAR